MLRFTAVFLMIGLSAVFTLSPVFAADSSDSAAKTVTKHTAKTEARSDAKSTEKAQVPMSVIVQNLHMNGYDIIGKIARDKDIFEVDAMSPQGKEIPVTMNAFTGEIMEPKHNPIPHVSLEDAVKRVESAGYHSISKVRYSGSKYEVEAYDQKNSKVTLKVNGANGEVKKSWWSWL